MAERNKRRRCRAGARCPPLRAPRARPKGPELELELIERAYLDPARVPTQSILRDLAPAGLSLRTGPNTAMASRRLGARAFTVGRDLFIPPPALHMERREDRLLLLHEAAHALQQGARSGALMHRASRGAELEAERFARQVEAGGAPPRLSPAPRAIARFEGAQDRVSTSADPALEAGEVLGARTADQWLEQHHAQLRRELAVAFRQGRFELNNPFAVWGPGGHAAFVGGLAEHLFSDTIGWMLRRVMRPDSLEVAVNRGRDLLSDPTRAAWAGGVVAEVLRIINLRVVESLRRTVPRLVELTAQGRLEPEEEPTPTPLLAPPPADLAWTHPIDGWVVLAMVGAVAVDVEAYRAAHPGVMLLQPAGPLRPVRFDFLAARGAPNWLRVIEPEDATREEVAFTLYGDAAQAHRLIAAGRMFGFPREDIDHVHGGLTLLGYQAEGAFTQAQESAYSEAIGEAEAGDDPAVQIMTGPLAQQAALEGALTIPRTRAASGQLVLQRLTMIISRLSDIMFVGPEFLHPTGAPATVYVLGPNSGLTIEHEVDPQVAAAQTRVETARARAQARFEELLRAPEERVLLWDAQSRGQLEVLNGVLAGLLTTQRAAEAWDGWPGIHSMLADAADTFIAAAEVSDLYPAATARLSAARDKLRLFPATAIELLLTEVRRGLREARSSEITAIRVNPGQLYDLADREAEERALRVRLAALRPMLLADPESAQAELQEIGQAVRDLQLGVTITVNMDAVGSAWQALFDQLTFVGEVRAIFGHSGNDVVGDSMDAALAMHQEWMSIYQTWQRDPEEGRRLFEEKRQSREWRHYFSRIRHLIRDQQQYDAWVTFGLMVGIALITGGIGAYVEGAAAAAWGTTAGFLIGTATEAAVFTSLSYVLVDREPSLSGFLEHLVMNMALFGGLRGIGVVVRGLGGGAGATLLAQFTALNGVSLYQANQEAVAATGNPLTTEQILSISFQNAAFIGAVALGARLGQRQLIQLRLRGELRGVQLRADRAAARLQQTVAQVQNAQAPSADQRAVLRENLDASVAAERALFEALERVIRHAEGQSPTARARLLQRVGVTEELAQRILDGEVSSDVVAVEAALRGVRVQEALEPVGPQEFLISSELFDAAVEFYGGQEGAQVFSSDNFFAPMRMQAMRLHGSRSVVISLRDAPPMRITERAVGERGAIVDPASLEAESTAAPARSVRELAEQLPDMNLTDAELLQLFGRVARRFWMHHVSRSTQYGRAETRAAHAEAMERMLEEGEQAEWSHVPGESRASRTVARPSRPSDDLRLAAQARSRRHAHDVAHGSSQGRPGEGVAQTRQQAGSGRFVEVVDLETGESSRGMDYDTIAQRLEDAGFTASEVGEAIQGLREGRSVPRGMAHEAETLALLKNLLFNTEVQRDTGHRGVPMYSAMLVELMRAEQITIRQALSRASGVGLHPSAIENASVGFTEPGAYARIRGPFESPEARTEAIEAARMESQRRQVELFRRWFRMQVELGEMEPGMTIEEVEPVLRNWLEMNYGVAGDGTPQSGL